MNELTLEKILKAKAIMEQHESDAMASRARDGYLVCGPFRQPKSKKRRIRRKWIKSGKAWTIRFVPPVNSGPQLNDL